MCFFYFSVQYIHHKAIMSYDNRIAAMGQICKVELSTVLLLYLLHNDFNFGRRGIKISQQQTNVF